MTKLDWESKRNIEEVVDQIAFSRVRRFYPTYIHKITGIPLNEVFNYLLILVEDDRLILKWEIRCPELECNSIMIRTEKIEDYLHQAIECNNCEEEVIVRGSIVFPVFEINDYYRSRVRELKKKEQNLIKSL